MKQKKTTPPKDFDYQVTNLKNLIIESASSLSVLPAIVAEGISDEMYENVMNRVEADPQWKSVGCKMALISSKVVIIEYPSEIHEWISREFNGCIIRYNMHATGHHRTPLRSLGSTRVRYGPANTCLESDESLANGFTRPEDVPKDPRGNVIPSIVFEVACSESYTSVQETASIYLENVHVQMVISIKVILREGLISQLYCVVHSRVDNNPPFSVPIKVISFGPEANPLSIQAILHRTHVAEENFVGIGRNVVLAGADDYPAALQGNDDVFSVIIPEAAIRYPLPVVPDHPVLPPCVFRLLDIVECLQTDKFVEDRHNSLHIHVR